MRLLLQASDRNVFLDQCLRFHDIEFDRVDLWHDSAQRHVIDPAQQGSVLILDAHCFETMAAIDAQHLISWLCRGNLIWVWCDQDGIMNLDHGHTPRLLRDIDPKIPPHSLWYFVDGWPDRDHWCHALHSVDVCPMPRSWFWQMPRIHGADLDKNTQARDYLLTMVQQPARPHRRLLWKAISARPGMLERGHVTYRPVWQKPQWVGHCHHDQTWPDGHPSMDLYRDSWFEIVPETRYRGSFFFTEKTVKPIATKTPFLVLSTPGYLKHLRGLGFRTFGDVIDESYDDEPDTRARTAMLVDVAQHIMRNGSQQFYQAVRPVLDHNQTVLMAGAGARQHEMDQFVMDCLGRARCLVMA